MRVAWLIAVVGALGACRVDLTDPYRPPPGSAVLDVVIVLDDSRKRAGVQAFLYLDPSAAGPTAPDDSILTVADLAIGPKPGPDAASLFYLAGWDFVDRPTADGSIPVEPPRLSGFAPESVALRAGVPWAAGSRDIVRDAGEDLVVTLAPPGAAPDPAPLFHGWSLLARARGRSFSITSDGVPPESVIVSASLLNGLPSSFSVDMRIWQRIRTGSTASGYVVDVFVEARLSWRVRDSSAGQLRHRLQRGTTDEVGFSDRIAVP